MTHEEVIQEAQKKFDEIKAEKERLEELKSNGNFSQVDENNLQIDKLEHQLSVLALWKLSDSTEIRLTLDDVHNITQERINNLQTMINTLQWMVDLKNQ